MTALVLDASVCLKWFLHERGDEADCEIALDLHSRVLSGRVALIQPPLWRAEIAAGLARMLPARARVDVADLTSIIAVIADGPDCLLRATDMAVDLRHHLFDTIYHAIAIEHETDLITADENYFRKARDIGRIVLLRDWRPPHEVREAVPPPYSRRARKPPARGRRKRR